MNLRDETIEQVFRTATGDVCQRLREAILKGELKPGARLVRRTLAKQFGVSHIPVTEALIKLEQDGLVESAPMFGARVKAVTLEKIREEQELREAIECHCARLCAQKMTPEKLVRLRRMASQVDRLMAKEADPASWEGMNLHLEFHLEVARQSEVPLLVREMQRIGFIGLMRASWINATEFYKMPSDWHEILVDALASGKVSTAEAVMRKHVRFGIAHLLNAARKIAA